MRHHDDIGHDAGVDELTDHVQRRNAHDAAEALSDAPPQLVADVLQSLNPAHSQDILDDLPENVRGEVLAAAPLRQREQWLTNDRYLDDSVGRLMEPPSAVFSGANTVGDAIETVREVSKTSLVTYGYVVDDGNRLAGVIAMRDLLLSPHDRELQEVMLRRPFFLSPEATLPDAMKEVVKKHYPVYPVCDASGVLLGQVRGQALFEEQAYEISAQPGRMVGVDKEERLTTSWTRSLKFRQPWLQLNLLTAFIAAAVVGMFQETIDRLVILAAFLPVLAGQSGNTGCQALAVALRGMTLGELQPGRERALILKEALLGACNGALVGVSAAIGMYVTARAQNHDAAVTLSIIVFFAMIGSCLVSGISGAVIPLTLRRLGADPATASSIFLTTATDVASMGLFLSLAASLIR